MAKDKKKYYKGENEIDNRGKERKKWLMREKE